MNKLFDISFDFIMPMQCSNVLKAIDDLQLRQDPPYSDGVYFIDARKEIVRTRGILWNSIFPYLLDPIFGYLVKYDGIYCS